jgi:phage tail-like protein
MPAPEFTVNTERYDPYLNYRFKVKWKGEKDYVAGVNKISALKRSTEVADYRAGLDPGVVRKIPGQTKYEPITLERGVTHDQTFEQWANKIWDYDNSASGPSPENIVSRADIRKDIVIELFNEAGQVVIRYNVHRCWVSSFQAMADLEGASGNTVLIQTLELQNEGWQRDASLAEPKQPSFVDPS